MKRWAELLLLGALLANLTWAQTPSQSDLAEVAAARILQARIGDEIWPGFSGTRLPILIYDASYAYLFGYDDPPPPWSRAEGYSRRPAAKEQAFAVQVGERWAGSIASLSGMNERVPIKISADLHVCLLLHELFHAFQATVAQKQFAQASKAYALEGKYPYQNKEFAQEWNAEGEALWRGALATERSVALEAARDFLRIRSDRRKLAGLPDELVRYEQDLEWLEGLAEYAEIRSYDLAARLPATDLPIRFKPSNPYKGWDLVRLKSAMGSQAEDLRFYLSGMAQAMMLDLLDPAWKKGPAGSLEEKLRRAVRRDGRRSPP